jgi:hypothetical protein
LWPESDQGRYAIFAPSAQVRAKLFQGTQQNAPNLYKALQLFWQFRIWPAQMIFRTWGRLINGGEGNMQKVANVVELVVASAAFGVFAEALREVLQGQDPRGRLTTAPASYVMRGLRSGAGTIAGDYLFGEFEPPRSFHPGHTCRPDLRAGREHHGSAQRFHERAEEGQVDAVRRGRYPRGARRPAVRRHVVDLQGIRLPCHVPAA